MIDEFWHGDPQLILKLFEKELAGALTNTIKEKNIDLNTHNGGVDVFMEKSNGEKVRVKVFIRNGSITTWYLD